MSLYHVTVNGQVHTVELRSRRGSTLTFVVGGAEYSVTVEQAHRPSLTQNTAGSVAAPVARPAPHLPAAAGHPWVPPCQVVRAS